VVVVGRPRVERERGGLREREREREGERCVLAPVKHKTITKLFLTSNTTNNTRRRRRRRRSVVDSRK